MKIIRALSNPKYSSSFVLGNVFPNFFRKRYVKKSKKFGLEKNYFILSFDCDTEKDIEVVEEVDSKLRKIEIIASYAVPGELLRLGEDVYSRLHKNGSEFLNHGYLSHTSYINESRSYISTLFYDQLTNDQVKDDVVKGHQNFIDVLNVLPLGFRTPHFGSYQKPNQLKFLYSLLSELNYSFSSSTTPVTAMWNGPIVRTGSGIIELPVSGCYDYSARILDSWNFRFSPTRKLNEEDYVKQFSKMIDFFDLPNTSGIFNIYADPSQVYDWEMFFECMKMTKNLSNISFSKLLHEVLDE